MFVMAKEKPQADLDGNTKNNIKYNTSIKIIKENNNYEEYDK